MNKLPVNRFGTVAPVTASLLEREKIDFSITKIKAWREVKISRFQETEDCTIEWQTISSPVIWRSKADTVPAAFLIDESQPAQLTVHITTARILSPGTYTLTGTSKKLLESTESNEKKEIVFSGSKTIEKNSKTKYSFKTTLSNNISFFLGIDSEFNWELTRTGENILESGPGSFVTFLELYWIYDYDGTLFPPGVPIEILRQLNLGCRTLAEIELSQARSDNGITVQPVNSEKFIVRAAVNSCFLRNPPRYDVTQKSTRYIQYNNLNHISLELADYLWSLRNPLALCNCFDQAAVLQVYLKAIGIQDVRYVIMGPEFYLKLTYLVGWGWCNNPAYNQNYGNKTHQSYLGRNSMPVTSEYSLKRSYCTQHAVCGLYWKKNDNKIIDSCTGPHTGNLNPDQYKKAVVDVLRTELNNIEYKPYYGVTHIDIISPQTNLCFPEKLSEFDALVDAPQIAIERLSTRFLAPTWPDLSKIDILKHDGWETVYQHLTPGPGETLKKWLLKRHAEVVEIKIYTASYDQYEPWARKRFISIGTSSTMPQIPFEKGPDFLGPFSIAAFSQEPGCGRYVWQSFNIVFDVTFNNVTFHPAKLLRWLHRNSMQPPVESKAYKSYPANMGYESSYISAGDNLVQQSFQLFSGLEVKTYTLESGSSFTISLVPKKHLEYYFMFQTGSGLRYTGKSSNAMTFDAVAVSSNRLNIIAVHKKKFLSAFKPFHIEIK